MGSPPPLLLLLPLPLAEVVLAMVKGVVLVSEENMSWVARGNIEMFRGLSSLPPGRDGGRSDFGM